MNDSRGLLERKHPVENVKNMEEASAFCKAYGEELEKSAKDKEKEIDESGDRQEARGILIILILIGVLINMVILLEGSDALDVAIILNGILFVVSILIIGKYIGRFNNVTNLKIRAEGFKQLNELKGLTEEQALEYTNYLIDRYNRMLDEDESHIENVYNSNYIKNPEKGARIATVAMGILVFLLIVFCVIKELIAL